MTPKRSLNMMWFLKVLLTSKSICLISVEKLRACCFILWRTVRRTNMWRLSEIIFSHCPHFKGIVPTSQGPYLVFSVVLFFDFLNVQKQGPGLASQLQRDAFIHTLQQLKHTKKQSSTRRERQRVNYTRCFMGCGLVSSLKMTRTHHGHLCARFNCLDRRGGRDKGISCG